MHDPVRSKTIIAGCLISILVLTGALYYVHVQEREAAKLIAERVAEQEASLIDIAVRTDDNAADPLAVSIVRDCSQDERRRFDQLLDRLGELSPTALQEAQSLFNACAHVFPTRKAVMVAYLEREYEMLREFAQMQKAVDDTSDITDTELEQWEQLIELEKERSRLFAEQVAIQQRIIDALRADVGVVSAEIDAQLEAARGITERAQTLDQEIDALRKTLHDV